MSRGIAAAATVVAGCLSVPPYEPAVSVSYTESGQGGTAAGPGFALHFADGAGFHFPDELKIDGTDVMGHEPSPGCFDEHESGIVFSPALRISAHSGATPVMNHLVPVLRGPAVVQVKLDWATRFDCNLARTPGGTATFTVFPDGRIVRYDTVVDPVASPIASSTCTCNGDRGLQFTVTAFWTFARTLFTKLHAPGAMDLPGPMDQVITNMAITCMDGAGYQIAFAWHEDMGMTIRSSEAAIGFGRDMELGDSTLDDFSYKSRSAIFIGRDGCDGGTKRALDYAAPSCTVDPLQACLSINGTPTMPEDLDGIFGGDSGHGQPGVAVGMGPTMLTGALGGSFAVWLRFPSAVRAVRAKLANAKGAWYLPQQVDDRSWIVWFRDPLSANQTITIEPR